MNLTKTVEALRRKGYETAVFSTAEEAAAYLNGKIDQTTVGMGGSVTLDQMGVYQSLSEHNQVFWHWYPQDTVDRKEVLRKAMNTEVYLTSANAISSDGEIVNIDGTGNRLAGTLFGHEKVYIMAGVNKIAENLHQAIDRARNTAAPLNAARLECSTPCTAEGAGCFDCESPDRICSAMVIHFAKMGSCKMEVVIVEEDLGF